MVSVRTRPSRPVSEILEAVKQLSTDELREFHREFSTWQGKGNIEDVFGEEILLMWIRRNSALSAQEQRRFNHLRRKHQAEQLAHSEEEELQKLATWWLSSSDVNAALMN